METKERQTNARARSDHQEIPALCPRETLVQILYKLHQNIDLEDSDDNIRNCVLDGITLVLMSRFFESNRHLEPPDKTILYFKENSTLLFFKWFNAKRFLWISPLLSSIMFETRGASDALPVYNRALWVVYFV